MAKWGELTPATIIQIAWEAKDGKADPEDARRLLELFCERVDMHGRIPPDLLGHLRDAFGAYLTGARTLEAALGLARKRGAPEADEERQYCLAAEVLKHRLAGLSLEKAVANVSEESPKLLESWGYKAQRLGETQIREAWAANKRNALVHTRIVRSLDRHPWRPEEIKRLGKIFAGEQWFIPPEK